MRNITNRIATNGFCALEAGTADYLPVYDDRLRSEILPCIERPRAYRQLNRCIAWPLLHRAAVFAKQPSAVRAAALQLLMPASLVLRFGN